MCPTSARPVRLPTRRDAGDDGVAQEENRPGQAPRRRASPRRNRPRAQPGPAPVRTRRPCGAAESKERVALHSEERARNSPRCLDISTRSASPAATSSAYLRRRCPEKPACARGRRHDRVLECLDGRGRLEAALVGVPRAARQLGVGAIRSTRPSSRRRGRRRRTSRRSSSGLASEAHGRAVRVIQPEAGARNPARGSPSIASDSRDTPCCPRTSRCRCGSPPDSPVAARNEAPERTMMTAAAALTSAAGAATKSGYEPGGRRPSAGPPA